MGGSLGELPHPALLPPRLESFIEFLAIRWPEDSWEFLNTSVGAVRDWRTFMVEEHDFAPKTLNRWISSLSGFFQFLREAAADAKLPITVQNPAHKDFITRPSTEPVEETKALTPGNARKLMDFSRISSAHSASGT